MFENNLVFASSGINFRNHNVSCININKCALPDAGRQKILNLLAMNATEKNKAIARRFYDEMLNEGKIEIVNDLIGDNYVEHEETPGIPPTKEGVKQWAKMMRNAFPDLKVEVEDMIAERDKVVIIGRMRGTHRGELFGNKGSGRKLNLPFVDVGRFQDGRAVEHWGYSDTLKMVEQLQLDLSPVQ